MLWNIINSTCNAINYSAVTVINTLGNITSPIYNFETDRKFDINSNITDTGLTMDDFDTDYSHISQELSKIKKKLIGELGSDKFSKFTLDVISDKIDYWISICNGPDFSDIKKDLSKIKIIFNQQFVIHDIIDDKTQIEHKGRYITNRDKIINVCKKYLDMIKNKSKKLTEDQYIDGENKLSVKKRINSVFNENKSTGNYDPHTNILNNLRSELEKIRKISSIRNILGYINRVNELLIDLIKDDIKYLKGENRKPMEKVFDSTIGHFANLTRGGRSYSMTYTFYQMYIDQVLNQEIKNIVDNKIKEYKDISKKITNIVDSFGNINNLIQKDISDGIIFNFKDNNKTFNINIGTNPIKNYLDIVDIINNQLKSKYPNDIVQGNDNINDDKYFEASFVYDLSNNGVPPLTILFKSKKEFVIHKNSSILPYIGYMNIDGLNSWSQNIEDNDYHIIYGTDQLSPQFTDNQRTNKKNHELKRISSLLISLCVN